MIWREMGNFRMVSEDGIQSQVLAKAYFAKTMIQVEPISWCSPLAVAKSPSSRNVLDA